MMSHFLNYRTYSKLIKLQYIFKTHVGCMLFIHVYLYLYIHTHKSCQSSNLSPQTHLCWRVELTTLRNASYSPSWVDQKDEAPPGIFLAPSSKKIVLALHCQQVVNLPFLSENTADNISLNLWSVLKAFILTRVCPNRSTLMEKTWSLISSLSHTAYLLSRRKTVIMLLLILSFICTSDSLTRLQHVNETDVHRHFCFMSIFFR